MEVVRGALPAGVPQPARRDHPVPPPVARATWGRSSTSSSARLQQAAGRPQDRRSSSTTARETWLADVGYDPVYGARPLKRVIQRELQNPLAAEDPRRPHPGRLDRPRHRQPARADDRRGRPGGDGGAVTAGAPLPRHGRARVRRPGRTVTPPASRPCAVRRDKWFRQGCGLPARRQVPTLP